MEHKIVGISSKHQITIPRNYYEKLGFTDKEECILQNDGIFIRPVRRERMNLQSKVLCNLNVKRIQ